jgi:competence protein ComEC
VSLSLSLPDRPVLGLSWLHRLAAAEHGRFAPWLAVALGGGVLVYAGLPAEPPWLAIWPAPLAALLAFALGWRRPLLGWALGLFVAGWLGFADAAWQAGRQPPMPELPRGATQIAGRVAAVEALAEGRRVTLDAASLDGEAPIARTLRLRLRADDPAAPQPGDRLSLRALVRPPAAPAYPGAWDFQRAAWFSGLGGNGFALGRATLTPGEGAPPLAALRAVIEARIAAVLPGAPGAIATALLTGSQSAIPAEALTAMRDSGLAHLLSVSGLHIAIVMGLAYGLLRWLLALVPYVALRLPGRPVAALGGLVAGGLYMLLTGAQLPMQRSFAMAAFATLALLVGRRAFSLRGWAIAFAAVVLIAPMAVLHPSFQMSFAAVLALIAGWEWLRPRLPTARGWRRRLWLAGFGLIATSLLAGLATTPYGLHHFGRLQAYGVAANALAVPLTSVFIMPAGMLAVALLPFGLEDWALRPMGWGITLMLAIARWVAGWPGASLAMAPLPGWGLALASLGLAWLCLWRARWRLFGLPLLGLGMAAGMFDRPPDILVSGEGRLIALHAGDGLFWQRLSGAGRLDREAFARRYGLAAGQPLPREGNLADGRIVCMPGACTLGTGAGRAVLLRGVPAEEACANAALVLSAEPVRGRCAAAVIDRFAVWRQGPHAVWLGPAGPRILSDRAARGDRPWVPPPPLPRGSPSPDPPAPVE